MHRLEFAAEHSYANGQDAITVPVELKNGEQTVRIAASIDTGASFCIFRRELAEALGFAEEGSERVRFRTANSSFEAFGREVEVAVLGVTSLATVFFFRDPAINKNVLGRTGWLDRVKLGLVHHDSRLFLADYSE